MKKLFPFCRLLFAAFIVSACGDSSSPVSNTEKSRVIEGIDFDVLFAKPTETEINAVSNEWATRDVSVQSYQEISSSALSIGGVPGTLRVVSHTVAGINHYGAVVVPNGKAARSLPVLVYAHGGDNGVSVSDLQLILLFNPAYADKFVFVIPSFRSEPLRVESDTLVSAGEPSPWDRDVDDALALLNVALQTTPEADPERLGILGFSRGACVGMLMAIRDPRIDIVVEFFGPADFLGEFAQKVTEEALLGNLADLPGLDYLNAKFIQPLKNRQITINDFRRELVRRSPVYFAGRLPQLQVHHGTADEVVPVAEAERLIAIMQSLGRTTPAFESYLYSGGGHNPLTLSDSMPRTFEFLGRLLSTSLAFYNK